ncbi:TonB-dependent receptor [Mariniphaga sediminis]|uniref:TonB-dependent receptor n=1 Tax=Mariniphaga sediminis TaxID=1628158 RepID=UPI003569082C
MKLTILLLFMGMMTISASIYSQSTKLSLDVKDGLILDVFKQIEDQSEFVFIYKNEVIDLNKRVNVKIEGATIEVVLDKLFEDSDVKYEILDKQIILTPRRTVPSKEVEIVDRQEEKQQPLKKTLTGLVTDYNGDPIPGATVVVMGTTIGTVTDFEGKFSLDVPINAKTLSFSFVGFQKQEVPIGNEAEFNVSLEELTVGLGEVVAIGYGSQKKATMTGAVSKLKGEALLTSPVSNITNSLQGKVTGVTTIQQNGQPGFQQADIFIRGRATIGDASAIVIVDGVEREDFGTIDPNEIESMSVLKDASSTAIFGIRGANGVLVITTKQGRIAEPTVSYSGNVSSNFFIDFPERLNAYETAKLQNIGAHNNGKSEGWNYYWTDEELEHFRKQDLPYRYPDVDWMETMIRKYNLQTQHNLSVRGGTKKVKYYISGGYLYTGGILNEFPSTIGIKTTDSYKKYNVRSNLDFDITKELRVGLKVAGTFENLYQPRSGGNLGRFFYETLNIPSNRSPIYTPDGRFAVGRYAPGHIPGNPIASITQSGYVNGQRNRIETNLDIDLKLNWLTKGLRFKTLVAYDNSMNSYLQQSAKYSAYYIDRITGEIIKHPSFLDDTVLSGYQSAGIWGPAGKLSYELQSGFDYDREFGKNKVTGLVRFTRRKTEINNAADAPFAYQGVVSRLTYNYNDKYLLEGSVAYNGSENFPKGKRYGIFPSGSVGYILSNERFFNETVSFINFLKVRGSVGLVGNDKFPGGTARFLYLDEYTVSGATTNWSSSNATHPGAAYYFGQPSAPSKYEVMKHNRIGNPNITWETGLKADVGIEVSFFQDKIKLVADYFHERRSDILIESRAGLTAYGEGYPKLNKGIVENKGYEIELDMYNKFGEVTLGLRTTISHSANMVIEADDPPGIPDYQKIAGKRVGQFFGYSTAGFYNSQQDIHEWPENTMAKVVPGDLKFVDYNNDGVINSMDKHPILTSNLPEYNYSFTPIIEYKNFSIQVLFQGTMNSMSDYLLTYNYFGFMKDSWTPENFAAGKTIIWPALRDDWNGPSIAPAFSNDFVIKPNDYLKLRNLEIAYQLPADFINKLSLSSARIYISGQNLATWSSFKRFYDVDPEVYIGGTGGAQTSKKEYAYPLARTINLGVNVQF